MSSKHSIEKFIQFAQKRGGFCLSTKYEGIHKKYHWKCEFGHEWLSEANSVINSNNWCDACARINSGNKRRNNIDYLHSLAKKNKGKSLSNFYSIVAAKYEWECEKGHRWFATANNIQRGKWCPICKESHGERKIRNWLESKNISFIRQHSFKDCYGISKKKKPLIFDFYLPEYNICIEYDGEQHFRPIMKFGNVDGYQKCQYNDKIKTEYCIKNNIHLIRIPYYDFSKIEDYTSKLALTSCGGSFSKSSKSAI
jgi:hypothetical protein